jgi:hypothetical protein
MRGRTSSSLLPHSSFLPSFSPSLLPSTTEYTQALQIRDITMQNVNKTAEQMESITGYKFVNKILCAEAAQMASPEVAVIFNDSFLGVENNKRLAILGDAILQKTLCAAWFTTCDHNGNTLLPLWSLLQT